MKSYANEFKEEAVKLAKEVGAVRAAETLGISKNTLYIVVKSFKNACKRHSTRGMLFHSDRGCNILADYFEILWLALVQPKACLALVGAMIMLVWRAFSLP